MSRTAPLLWELAGAVSEREQVDWVAAERSVSGALDRAVVRQLRVLAEVAESTPRGSWTGEASQAARTSLDIPSILLGTVAMLQIVLALAGFVLGTADGRPVVAGGALAVMVAFVVSALVLLHGGRRDQRALGLALFFLLVADSLSHRFVLWLAPVTPTLARASGAVFPDALVAWSLWRFVRDFPRVVHFSRLDRLMRAGQRLSWIVGLTLLAANAVFAWAPGLRRSPLSLLGRTPEGHFYWGSVFAFSLAAIVGALFRARAAADAERRRLRVFVAGLALGTVPILIQVLLEVLSSGYDRFSRQPDFRLASSVVFYSLLASIPFTTAFAIRTHRILDVHLVVQRTLQYALARASLFGLTAIPFAVLARDLYVRRALPLSQVVGGPRGRVLAVLGVSGLALLALRPQLLKWIDHLFARSSGSVPDLLLTLADELRAAPDTQTLTERARDNLRRSLGAEHVALFVPRGRVLEPLGTGGRPLSMESACWVLAQQADGPLLVDPEDRHSLFSLLPEEDRLWIADGNVALIVPAAATDGALVGLMTLGPKRSGEGWSRTDRAVLVTVVGSIALALENQRMRATASSSLPAADAQEPARLCPGCSLVHPSDLQTCPCGGATHTASLPRLVQAKFRVERLIGRGAMGVVYAAHDETLGRAVALKTLSGLGERASLRLRREARAMAAVEHPNLVVIHGAESWRGTPILVLEYLAGGCLTQRLAQGTLPLRFALNLGHRLASALDCVHRAGLLHRDIKPSNIGFAADGTPKLLDFGLASLMEEGSRAGPPFSVDSAETARTLSRHASAEGIAGTPLYLSPEIVRGHRADAQSDLWALCVVLYEAVTGVQPFRGATIAEVFNRIRNPVTDDIRRWRPDCPEAVAAFFSDALAPSPQRRPHTAGGLVKRLLALEVACSA